MKSKTEAGMGRKAMDQHDSSKTTAKEKEPKVVQKVEHEVHPGLYNGPHNQTLVAGHGERKEHEDHHPAVKRAKGKK